MKKSESKFQGKYLFLTVPHLEVDQDQIDRLKTQVFNEILTREGQTLEHLGVVRETHKDWTYHMHVYVQYTRRRTLSPKHFDYLFKHPNVQVVRGLKQVLSYLTKEDSKPLFTKGFNPCYQVNKLRIEKEPYALLREAMLKDPLNFEPHAWLAYNNLDVAASKGNWPKAIALVKQRQQIEACNTLKHLPGFKEITRNLIESNLSKQQLAIYDSWEGYQVIVDHLNQIVRFGGNRPRGSTNLMIVSQRSGIGKTSLFDDDNLKHYSVPLSKVVPTYIMGMKHWFPKYQSNVFRLILWNQMRLGSYSYDLILKLLEGFPVDLPYHGGAAKKTDNPLVVMTSNVSLERHITIKFTDLEDQELAKTNLKRRVVQVVVPDHLELFLLQKLVVHNAPETH